jgi:hypothetical protein
LIQSAKFKLQLKLVAAPYLNLTANRPCLLCPSGSHGERSRDAHTPVQCPHRPHIYPRVELLVVEERSKMVSMTSDPKATVVTNTKADDYLLTFAARSNQRWLKLLVASVMASRGTPKASDCRNRSSTDRSCLENHVRRSVFLRLFSLAVSISAPRRTFCLNQGFTLWQQVERLLRLLPYGSTLHKAFSMNKQVAALAEVHGRSYFDLGPRPESGCWPLAQANEMFGSPASKEGVCVGRRRR